MTTPPLHGLVKMACMAGGIDVDQAPAPSGLGELPGATVPTSRAPYGRHSGLVRYLVAVASASMTSTRSFRTSDANSNEFQRTTLRSLYCGDFDREDSN